MQLRNTRSDWGMVSMLLHWLIVLLVLAAVVLAQVMDELPRSVARLQVYAVHKSIGITVLALMLVRLAWRFAGPRPLSLPGTARWQAAVAELTHWALYAALIAMPLSGWLYNSASNFPLQWFGLFNLPPISGRSAELKDFAHDLHENLYLVIVVLVALHAGAAFWHHFVRRDATLDRMLPARWRRRQAAAAAIEDTLNARRPP